MQGNDALNAVMPVIAEFDRLGVPYYIGGSLASSAHGIMRATVDADLVADLKPQHVDPLVEALRADYYIDGRMIRGAIAERSCCNLIHLATSFKVDIFVLRGRPYDRAGPQREASDRSGLTRHPGFLGHTRRHGAGETGMVSTRQRSFGSPVARHPRHSQAATRPIGSRLHEKMGVGDQGC